MVGNKKLTTHLFVIAIYLILSIAVTWPLVFHLNSLVIDPHDGLLNTWMLNWAMHSFSSGLNGLVNYFNANIFFPFKNTFAFSDLQLPLGLITAPIIAITGEPLVGYNFSILLGFVLTAYSAFIFSNYLGLRKDLSFFTGLLISFSTSHLSYITHQQAFHLWPIIFAIYSLLSNKKILFIFFLWVSSLNFIMNLYLLMFAFGIYILIFLKDIKKWILSFGIGLVLILPFLIPYLLVSRQFKYTRPITDTIHFSLHYDDLINVGKFNRLSNYSILNRPSTPAFFGVAGLILVVSLIFFGRKNFTLIKIKDERRIALYLLLLGILFFILSFGPGFHLFRNTVHVGPIPLVPTPYLIFYYLLPGFQAFRAPSRWILYAFVFLTLASIYILKHKINRKVILILSAFIILELNVPLTFYHVPAVNEFPPEQVWLKNNYEGAPIVQFPIYNWDDTSPLMKGSEQVNSGFGVETLREYYSTIHWHPMYNGYSGFSPPAWEKSVKWLQKEFPSKETINFLRDKGIKLVLVPVDWQSRISAFNELKLVQSFTNTLVYTFND